MLEKMLLLAMWLDLLLGRNLENCNAHGFFYRGKYGGAVGPWELARLRPRVSKDSEFMN